MSKILRFYVIANKQIRTFLDASDEVKFKGRNRGEVYAWVSLTLRQQRYRELKRRSRGLVRCYFEKHQDRHCRRDGDASRQAETVRRLFAGRSA